MLYRLGRVIEAHAVSRFILEQIAWAYEASRHDDVTKIEAVSATKSVRHLKDVITNVGPLYGALSKYAHLGYDLHHEVLTKKAGRTAFIVANQRRAVRHELVLIQLADACAIVYEISQRRFMRKLESVRRVGDSWALRPKRPIVRVHRLLVKRVERAEKSYR
jgi:hypothetical protein